jgi:hypothetical protein
MLEKISLYMLADRAVGKKVMTILSAIFMESAANGLTLEGTFCVFPS